MLKAYEVEELVLHESAAERCAEGAFVLRGQFVVCVIARSAIAPIHILIIEEAISRTVHRVRTLLRHGVDTATRKSALAHIIRRNDNLHLLNSVHTDWVCTGSASVCAARRQAKDVVSYDTVNVERVVAVVRSHERDATRLARNSHRREFYHLQYVAVDGRRSRNLLQ